MSLDLTSIQGLKIVSANSSLKNLSIRLENEIGLSLDAIADEDEFMVRISVLKAQELAIDSDAVCSVDWAWIYGSTLSHPLILDVAKHCRECLLLEQHLVKCLHEWSQTLIRHIRDLIVEHCALAKQ